MPVKIIKHEGGFRVSTPHGIKSKHTTLKKAKAQKRLLNAVEHGFKPMSPIESKMRNFKRK